MPWPRQKKGASLQPSNCLRPCNRWVQSSKQTCPASSSCPVVNMLNSRCDRSHGNICACSSSDHSSPWITQLTKKPTELQGCCSKVNVQANLGLSMGSCYWKKQTATKICFFLRLLILPHCCCPATRISSADTWARASAISGQSMISAGSVTSRKQIWAVSTWQVWWTKTPMTYNIQITSNYFMLSIRIKYDYKVWWCHHTSKNTASAQKLERLEGRAHHVVAEGHVLSAHKVTNPSCHWGESKKVAPKTSQNRQLTWHNITPAGA